MTNSLQQGYLPVTILVGHTSLAWRVLRVGCIRKSTDQTWLLSRISCCFVASGKPKIQILPLYHSDLTCWCLLMIRNTWYIVTIGDRDWKSLVTKMICCFGGCFSYPFNSLVLVMRLYKFPSLQTKMSLLRGWSCWKKTTPTLTSIPKSATTKKYHLNLKLGWKNPEVGKTMKLVKLWQTHDILPSRERVHIPPNGKRKMIFKSAGWDGIC